jgi:chaperonin GroES
MSIPALHTIPTPPEGLPETIRCLFDWCLVRVVPTGDRTQGGIILPGSRRHDELKRVVVLRVGEGPYLINGEKVDAPLKVGEVVLIHKAAGHKLYEDQNDLLLIKAGDSRAVVG